MTTAHHPNQREIPVEAYLESWGKRTPIPAPSNWWAGWEDHRQPQLDQEARIERAEQAFDQLNPDFGVLADHFNPVGQRTVQDREAGLALGTRVAVAVMEEHQPDRHQREAAITGRVRSAGRLGRVDRLRQARVDRQLSPAQLGDGRQRRPSGSRPLRERDEERTR